MRASACVGRVSVDWVKVAAPVVIADSLSV